MTDAVARDRSMRGKIMEAFACLRLEQAGHRQLVDRIRGAVEAAGLIADYSHYARLASGALEALQPL